MKNHNGHKYLKYDALFVKVVGMVMLSGISTDKEYKKGKLSSVLFRTAKWRPFQMKSQ